MERQAETRWNWRGAFLPQLAAHVPALLKSQNPETGRFGTGIWIVQDQHAIFPLAAAWATNDPANPFYRSPDVLEAVGKGGDALIAAQDAIGKWVFRKKDDTTWGDIWMPWTYSRWVRAYALVKDTLPDARRDRWERALRLGYGGIAERELSGAIHNIPAHHAMGLYVAGGVLERPDWQAQSADFLRRVAQAQNETGYWSENNGPVVVYNYVYVDALGVYYRLSGDDTVLPALTRAARFHAALTYPDGSAVETVDERQVYHDTVMMPNVGFAWSAEGRGYARQQWETIQERTSVLGADVAAAYLLYGPDDNAPAITPPGASKEGQAILGENQALLARHCPWFWALSAYTSLVPSSRWIQDRQNMVSVFHDRAGLILGGGNTKLQPLWSTFTVGDLALWKAHEADENPDFIPPADLYHVPWQAELRTTENALLLTYGDENAPVQCSVSVARDPAYSDTLLLSYACATLEAVSAQAQNLTVAAHLPFLVTMGAVWRTASGRRGRLEEGETLCLTADETGDWFDYGERWRVSIPSGATLRWPVKPHDPYTKNGVAAPELWRLVLSIPLTHAAPAREIRLSVLPVA